MSFRFPYPYLSLFGLACIVITSTVHAGVTNPDISVIGLMRTFITNDATDINRDRVQFSLDETELVADAALNPYAHGTFVLAIADGGIEVEEGFFTIDRGLPQGFAVKGGKYRVGFGRLNPVHDHAYPFIERFRVLAEYLPGDESYNETGGQLSYRLPLPGDLSSTISADVLQGNSFHPDEEESRPAVLARWSNFILLKDPSALDVGVSFSQGTNNVAMKTKSTLFGIDAKAKLWQSTLNYLVLQGEVVALDCEYGAELEDGSIGVTHVRPWGGYLFADYTIHKRYNVGAKFEQYQRMELDENGDKSWDSSYGLFCGASLMEETTLFRLVWDHFAPDGGDGVDTYTLQVLFSMGPHKAHQF